MNQRQVRGILDIDQIVIVQEHLLGRQLALVDNDLVGQRADVEPLFHGERVRGMFAQDKQLALEISLVKCAAVLEHNERLEDGGLL